MASRSGPSEVERRIMHLWLKRPEDKRTGNDVLIFYGEMEKAGWPVLDDFRPKDDKYQALKSVLSAHTAPDR
jgi:hypothetical protein